MFKKSTIKADFHDNNTYPFADYLFKGTIVKNYIPTSVLEFLARRIHQDSLLFAAIASLIMKLGYFFLMDVQLKGFILIVIFFYAYFFNFLEDIYRLYIGEPFYQLLVYGMGRRALFPESFTYMYYEEDYWNTENFNISEEDYIKDSNKKYDFQEPTEHLGNIIFRNFLFCLVLFRLYIRTYVYIFLIIHTIIVYFLLFNQFLLTAYLISFLLISSRMVFHVTDFTSKDVQRSYKEWYIFNVGYSEKLLSDNTPRFMLPTWNNAILLTLHIFRFENIDGSQITRNNYLESYYYDYLFLSNVNQAIYQFENLSLNATRSR